MPKNVMETKKINRHFVENGLAMVDLLWHCQIMGMSDSVKQ